MVLIVYLQELIWLEKLVQTGLAVGIVGLDAIATVEIAITLGLNAIDEGVFTPIVSATNSPYFGQKFTWTR